MSRREPKAPWSSRIKNFLYGEKTNIAKPSDFERLGLKWTRDWQLAFRLERLKAMQEELSKETDPEKRLAIDNQYLEEIATFWGTPASNEFFFTKYSAWKRLYAYYQIGKRAGDLSDRQLDVRAIKLHTYADHIRAASIDKAQMTPDTPIILQLMSPGDARFSNWDEGDRQQDTMDNYP